MQRGRSEATEARADAEHANHRRRHEQGDAASAVPDGAGVGASGSTDDAADGENIFERFTLDQTRRFGQGAYGVTFAASDTANGAGDLNCMLQSNAISQGTPHLSETLSRRRTA